MLLAPEPGRRESLNMNILNSTEPDQFKQSQSTINYSKENRRKSKVSQSLTNVDFQNNQIEIRKTYKRRTIKEI